MAIHLKQLLKQWRLRVWENPSLEIPSTPWTKKLTKNKIHSFVFHQTSTCPFSRMSTIMHSSPRFVVLIGSFSTSQGRNCIRLSGYDLVCAGALRIPRIC
jgi:hypothetical protein